jgi:hypothetical protein
MGGGGGGKGVLLSAVFHHVWRDSWQTLTRDINYD